MCASLYPPQPRIGRVRDRTGAFAPEFLLLHRAPQGMVLEAAALPVAHTFTASSQNGVLMPPCAPISLL